MMKLNGVAVVERYGRPGVLSRTALRLNVFNNGVAYDLYDISSVTLFSKARNVSPSTVLESSSQVISTSAAEDAKFRWVQYAGAIRDISLYDTAEANQPYIYSAGVGEYVVVLSPEMSSTTLADVTLSNEASSVGEYIDVWTVKHASTSDWSVIINNLKLYADNFVVTTEPLMLKSQTKLIPNAIRLGEIINLKVGTEITVLNKNLDQNVKNTLSEVAIQNPKFRILKHNEDTNLAARVEVSGYQDTSSLIEVTGDNTMLFSLDTAVLTDNSIAGLGAGTGTYSVEAKYDLMDETIISPMMYFTVR